MGLDTDLGDPQFDAFQKQLDDEPENWALKLVFADWLEERNDWRAEGYRWLGFKGRFAVWNWWRAKFGGRRSAEEAYCKAVNKLLGKAT